MAIEEKLKQMTYLIGGLYQNMHIDRIAWEKLKKENEEALEFLKENNSQIKESVLSKLGEDQQVFISLLVNLNTELVNQKIITSMQKKQSEKYMLDIMEN